ncbi:MAG TPA: class I SAM-dependent methyltransferase [Stellaceae bacterium]|nr:class I SAM-dependent methyltransferase [Stellaceae bacterium]
MRSGAATEPTQRDPPDQGEAHFRFGENWLSFLDRVTPESIAEAGRGLERLVDRAALKDRRILDIGCGSGLSMLAALRLGAAFVEGVDIDPDSVAATRALLSRHAVEGTWSARVMSVFDLDPERLGRFDVVHSWGALHHTGAMGQAIDRAAAMVAPGGRLVLALYRRSPMCGFWKCEKRVYAAAPPLVQALARALYKTAYVAGLVVTGRNPRRYIAQYRSVRGMDWAHDVHDWLGGHPYESTEPGEVTEALARMGFVMERVFEHRCALFGLLGSHCDEYVAIRGRD